MLPEKSMTNMASGAMFVKMAVSSACAAGAAKKTAKMRPRRNVRLARMIQVSYLDMVPVSTGPCPSPTVIDTDVLYAEFVPVISASYRARPHPPDPMAML